MIQHKIIQQCFNAKHKISGKKGVVHTHKYTFHDSIPNIELHVKEQPFKPECQIVLVTGTVEHTLYEGEAKEIERKIKVIAMETSLKVDDTNDTNY